VFVRDVFGTYEALAVAATTSHLVAAFEFGEAETAFVAFSDHGFGHCFFDYLTGVAVFLGLDFLTGSSAVRFDATGATRFDATGWTFEFGVVGVVEDCCVGTEGTVD